ncbi:MAG: penicillin acylase family protein [bacterium]
MTKGWRRFFGFFSFIVIILITLTFLSYRLLTNSLSKTSGLITLDALESPVKVYRDEFGVPHIFAKNERDLLIASGYITAQDRLWQMDWNRRVASGRLSEIFGEATIESDKLLRVWGFARTAKETVKILSPESRMALEAYAVGVNAYIESHQDRLPLEFTILRYKPEEWKIEDSIAYIRFLAWKLSFSWYVDIVLGQLVEKLGEKKAHEIFPDFPKQGPFIISSYLKPFWADCQQFLLSGLQLRNLLGMHGAILGSNSWVVSGEKSACGKPLLANDPHLELTTPSVWYEMHLSGGDINVAGVALPGMPGIVIGHNQKIAWGLTNGMVDDADFYIEKLNPEDSLQYWYRGKWENLEIIEEQIVVKGADPILLQIAATRNGPVITKIHPSLQESLMAVSMRWTGHQPSDEAKAFIQLQKAKNWEEFTDALRNYKVPAQNFIFASTDGDIGYYLGGAIPIRKNATGILPHKGWSEDGQWIGEVPFEKLPHSLNPLENYIVTANNKIIDEKYPYYITNLWEPPSRAARIHQLLSEKDKFSIEEFKSMQRDVVSVHAQKIMPILLSSVETKLSSSSNDSLQTLFSLIKDWDGRETTDSIATSIFQAFFLRLTENTFKDEMGDLLYRNYIRFGSVPYRVTTALLEKGNSEWFDNINTPKVETREDIIAKSLLDAGEMLRDLAGDNISRWAWGEIHKLTMAHPLGVKKPLDIIFNIGPHPRGGSKMTINNGEFKFDEPFDSILGASTRQLVDLCDISSSLSVITTGQSGQRMSNHYKDQTALWLSGNYHSMIMDSTRIAETAEELLVLIPK